MLKVSACRIALTCIALVSVLLAGSTMAQTPLGTAFTYQGNLELSGSPVDGTADFQFKLFGALTAGSQVGSTQSSNNLTVVKGAFTALLDFGPGAFNGDKRFLEILVRSPAGSGSFITLTPRQELTASPYALKVRGIDGNSLDASDGSPTDALFVDADGEVGIGTTSPSSKLHIKGPNGTVIQIDGTTTGSPNLAWMDFGDVNGTDLGFVGDGSSTDSDVFLGAYAGDVVLWPHTAALTAKPDGKVGIGTSTPTQKLGVAGGAIMVENAGNQADLFWFATERSWVFRQQDTGTAAALKLQSVGGGGNKNFLIDTAGFVGIGTLNPQAKLDVNGTARVDVLEITGADLAERFPSSDTQVEPGSVMEIDPENPGELRVARGAYSRRVAGVVSGANDFAAGAILGHQAGHEDAPPIALSGRVYVRCDATAGAIEPGDLLTTSDTPGHAMKATDLGRSHGAIIGKAMASLAEGRGFVLVLVNLQ